MSLAFALLLGFRLYLLCAADGMPIRFELAPANAPERKVAQEILDGLNLQSYTGLGDKGFAGEEFEQIIARLGARLLRHERRRKRIAGSLERLLAEPLRRREGLLFEQLIQVCPERGCLSMAILRSVVVGLAPALGVSQRLTRDFDG